MCALSLSTTANVGFNREMAKMRVLLNKTLLLHQRRVSMQSPESKQRAELFFLCLRGLQVLGRARGTGKYTVLRTKW